MKAITQQVYGDTDVLSYTDMPDPTPGPDEVLIRVRAAGVDPSAWHLMTGLPYASRLAFGLRRPKLPIRGWDVAGVVADVGSGVTRFQRGDHVFGTCDGSFAELACASEDRLQLMPSNLDFTQAAALPTSGMTALAGLRTTGRVQAGQQVLIIGAGGGVGHLAVQIATADGAHVTGVCSASKAGFVTALGAEHVIDYTRAPLTGRYDLILDMAGNRPLRDLRPLLTDTGTLVLGGGENGGRWLAGTDRSMRAMLLSPFTTQRLRGLLSLPDPESLRQVAELAAAGSVIPTIARTFALADAAAAIDYLMTSSPAGKVALTIG